MNSAQKSVPRGFRPTYIPCLDAECEALLKQYEELGDTDLADHLIVSQRIAAETLGGVQVMDGLHTVQPEMLGPHPPPWHSPKPSQEKPPSCQGQCGGLPPHPSR
jgi:hypothetical protein